VLRSQRPADLDLRLLDEKNMNPTTQDEDMFLAALGLSDSDFQGSPGAVEKLLNNRAVRRFSPKRISDLIAYGIYAFKVHLTSDGQRPDGAYAMVVCVGHVLMRHVRLLACGACRSRSTTLTSRE
jgi:hypothetical protein